MGQAIADGVDARGGGRELRAAGIPAEDIVVSPGFPAGGFHVRDAGEQAPVQGIGIGNIEELVGVPAGWATAPIEKLMERGGTRIEAVIRGGRPVDLLRR